MQANLYIVVEGRGVSRPIRLARVTERELVVSAANAALCDANEKAEELGGEQTVAGRLQKAEAIRLRTALRTAIPELWL